MACESVTDIVVRETGRFLPGTIYGRTFGRSPWMGLVRRGIYPAGLSETINVLTYERTVPTEAEPTWSDVVVVDGQEGGACLPPVTEIGFGSTTRNFNLKRRAIHGPRFCAEEFRTVFDLEMQLSRIADQLAGYTMHEWDIRDRHEYFRNVQTKVSVTDCYNPTETSTGATVYPAVCPTMPLSLAVLERYQIQLLRDGATGVISDNGSPVLTVIASRETIGNIIRANADIRNDIRWADSGAGDNARLLKAFGINSTYAGFMFIADMFPRRFTCSAGTFTEVPAFDSTAATKGMKGKVRDAWRIAPYEESFIFDPDVFHQLIPQPIVAPHPKFVFDPVTYTGDWKILNIPDEVCNPDGNQIRHRGILAAGSMPVHPERGVAFVHLRCDPSGCITTCTS